jgi:hypothetical protein
MTVFRALRGAACAVFVPIAVIIIAVMFAVPTVRQVSAADGAVAASTPSGATTPTTVTSLRVASEGPTPGAVAVAPRVGPLDAGVGGAPGHGVWWLFGLGALQVVGLFVMMRRRARLSSPDTAS